MKTIKWGIIGCGNVTEKKSGPAFNKVEHSKLVAVMRRDASLAEDFALRHGVPLWFSDAQQLIHHPEVNAVYVATPPDSHASYAIMAMKAGKAVYVEKPMARTYQECLDMIKVSEETGVPLFVAYYRRTLPGFLKVKELVDEGFIGKPLMVNIRLFRQPDEDEINGRSWRVNPKIAGGGIFYDLASHQLDFCDFLVGPTISVGGCASNRGGFYDAEDTVTASWSYESGIVGSGSWCFVTREQDVVDEMEIIGSKGKIVFSGFKHSPIRLINSEGIIEFPYLNPENIQYNLIKQVTESIRSGVSCCSTGYSAARTNWMMEQIVSGYYQ
jgi:predicted dehydrogenase